MRPCDKCGEIFPDRELRPMKIGYFGEFRICDKCYKKAMKWMGRDNVE